MFYYQILTNVKQTGILTFSSNLKLEVGRVVNVSIRNRQVIGVVYSTTNIPNFKTNEIVYVYDIILPIKTINFINLFSFHTLQNINEVFNAYLPSLNILIKESVKNKLSFKINNNIEKTKTINPVFTIEKDLWFRIKYIIRSLKSISQDQYISNYHSKQNDTKNILFIFPEKSYIKKYYKKIESLLKDKSLDTNLTFDNIHFNLSQFSSQSVKMSKNALFSLYLPTLLDKNESKNNQKPVKLSINLILGTRSLLFLPYNQIDEIYFFEENDSSYIQEQNSLYFDTRDGIFYLSYIFNAKLNFISTLPSIRLLKFYSPVDLQQSLSVLSQNKENPFKMQIYEQNYQDMFFNLFSNEILNKIEVISSE